MKAPSVSSDAGGVFSYNVPSPPASFGNEPQLLVLVFRKDDVMPIWMEILINVIGYAGFIAIATLNRSSEKPAAESCAQDGVS